MVVAVLVRRVVVLSQYNGLVFVVMVRRLFVFRRFDRAKYIQSKTINQINDRCRTRVKDILVTIIFSLCY